MAVKGKTKSKKTKVTDGPTEVLDTVPLSGGGATKGLTSKQAIDGEKRYAKLVEDSQKEELKACRSVLEAYWNRGRRVGLLLAEPGKYGNKTASNFGRDIRPKKPYGDDEVRKWHRFNRLWTLDGLNKVIEQTIPWRGVQALLGVPDQKQRDALQERLATDPKFTTDDVRDIVKKANQRRREAASKSSKGKVERRGGIAVGTVYRNLLGFINDFAHKLDDFTEACKRHDKTPEHAEPTESDKRRRECHANLKLLVPKFNRALKAADKLPVEAGE